MRFNNKAVGVGRVALYKPMTLIKKVALCRPELGIAATSLHPPVRS
jgi:hypothetical protein